MKTSKLTKLAWALFALAVTSTTLYAQGWNNGKQAGYGWNKTCLNQISDLSDEQKTKINALNETHQEKMAKLRTKRQSTTDAIEKSEIRTTMLKNVKAHRDEVKSLLTAEQQKKYDQLLTRGNYGNGCGNRNFQCRGQGRSQQFAGNPGCGYRGNRGFGGQGYGHGNRNNQGCFRY
jgi:Spy/CpxP family protein refolding chaperone